MNNDLNLFMPKSAAIADYGVRNPVNVWPDAGQDIHIRSYWLPGGVIWQQGHDKDFDPQAPAIWFRVRAATGVWSKWAQAKMPAPAPEPKTSITSPKDGDTVDPLVPITGTSKPNAEIHLFTQGGDHAQSNADADGNFVFDGSHPLGSPGASVTIQAKAEGTANSPVITVTIAGVEESAET